MIAVGYVDRVRVGVGTQHEYDAAVLIERATGHQYVMRRAGGNPFEIDPEFERLIGANDVVIEGAIASTGFRRSTVIVKTWDALAGES